MTPNFPRNSQPKLASNNFSATLAQSVFKEGYALHKKGQLLQAQQIYQRALKLEPRHFESLYMMGMLAGQTGNSAQAVQWIDKALVVNPNYASAHSNRGNALNDLGQHQAAVQSYDKAIALKSDHWEAFYNRGIALNGLKQYQTATESYDKAIALKPDYWEAYYNRGIALTALKQYQVAIESFNKAIAVNPAHAEAYYNRGIALNELKQYQAAIDSYDKAIGLRPDYALAHTIRGDALHDLKQPQAAIDSYGKAIAIDPEDAEAHWNLSLCQLQMGDFRRGWANYEWRWKSTKIESFRHRPVFLQPRWTGEQSLQDKIILLYSEQGLGDTIQFCRYASLVGNLGARVLVQVHRPLLGLLSGVKGITRVLAQGDELPAFDYQCPLMSLPLVFKTEVDTIPVEESYISSDPAKLAYWRASLGNKTRARVGLVWSGSSVHKNDAHRSLMLSDFIKQLPANFQYISLHKEIREADLETLALNPLILHYENELMDFTDTAALCELMDVIISVDTSVAHLSGAMGKPTWVLLPFVSDWRWLIDREDSPWYPGVKLYRQAAIGNWSDVFTRLGADLLRLVEQTAV
jgi:tetratricopeptide (TPR) repeat protein